jgi:superfamily II DNA or RNA helicase
MTSIEFPSLPFHGELRPSQRAAVDIARRQLAAGQHKLHVVAPPGSGKTILGLWLWAHCVRRPALVLSPNSAIQAQWAAKTALFGQNDQPPDWVSTNPEQPALFTSLTYQAVTLPDRGSGDLDAQAAARWQDKLIEKGQAKDHEEAAVWIEDLKRHNPAYYEGRMAAYRKEVRDLAAMGGQALQLLHASCLATLERLKQRRIGLIILDECHHLLCHWGRVLSEMHAFFEHPVVLGLTATPPDRRGQRPEDLNRYDQFIGPVDYEVPVPAVVKDGFLAPYQDLVQFVRPTADELAFVANADEQFNQLVEELCGPPALPPPAIARNSPGAPAPTNQPGEVPAMADAQPMARPTAPHEPQVAAPTPAPRESLPQWIARVLAERRLPVGAAKDWQSFANRDEQFANAARWFLQWRGVALPPGVPIPPARHIAAEPAPRLPQPASATRAASASAADMAVLVPVLDRYIRHRLRNSRDPADHDLAEQAIARLRMLGVQITETGSQVCASPVGRVLMYSRSKIAALIPILRAERQALQERIRAVIVTDYEKTSAVAPEVGHLLDEEAGGAVAAFRELLQHAETDSLNPVLVTGSSVLVDDDLAGRFADAAAAWLAGRGLDVALTFDDEQGFKVMRGAGAHWCPRIYVEMITELFQQGLTKCLVGTRGLLGEGWDATKVNVLVDLTTATTSTSVNQLRGRSFRLDPDDPLKLADNWDVICLAPEFTKGLDDYQRFIDKHNPLFGATDDGAIEKGVGHVHAAFTEIRPEGIEDSMALLNAEMLERPMRRAEFRKLWKIGQPYRGAPIHAVESKGGGGGGFPPFPGAKAPWSDASLASAVGAAVLGALRETGQIPAGDGSLQVGARAGGYVRSFLKDASAEASALFAQALREALGPLENPRYVIPRYVHFAEETWLSRILPRLVGQYLRRTRRAMEMLHAVPAALARNKDLVAVYQRYWNAYVSPGKALYARQGEGMQLLERAAGLGAVPQLPPHQKEVFL